MSQMIMKTPESKEPKSLLSFALEYSKYFAVQPIPKGGIEYLGGFQPELLDVGGEYLLFTTQPSRVGLSTMVGLGQGAFKVVVFEKEDAVLNGVNNHGLFRGIDSGEFPASGPINYAALATRIRAELAN